MVHAVTRSLGDTDREIAEQQEAEEFPRLRHDVGAEQLRAMAEALLLLQNGQD